MTGQSRELDSFGLTPEWRAELEASLDDGLQLGRVVAVNRTNCEIETDTGARQAELTGRLRFTAEDSLDLPAVGDWVSVMMTDDLALITDVLPRRTMLKRRRPGTTSQFQVVAANVDVAFIVHGCNLPVNPRRLERFAAMVADGGAQVRVVLTKMDLLAPDEHAEAIAAASHLGEPIAVSAMEPGGLEPLAAHLRPGVTFVLLGPSGAGKTTLLNGLTGHEAFATGAVREIDGKGKHTTTRRHMARLPGGALIVDTPGMRELGMTDSHEGIDNTFAEVSALAESCRFRDCSHTGEAGCAVEAAIEEGQLDRSILDAFLKLEREAAHYERSVAERRHRDKQFGKHIKATLKGKKDRR